MTIDNMIKIAEQHGLDMVKRVIGSRTEIAYFDDATRSFYAVTAADLRLIPAAKAEHGGDWYSHWCGMTSVRDLLAAEVE